MEKVGFFTPVSFGNQPKSCGEALLEKADGYFYLGGKKASVIRGQEVTLVECSPSFLPTVLKVISYFTVILPLIVLAAKAILRSVYTFHIAPLEPKEAAETDENKTLGLITTPPHKIEETAVKILSSTEVAQRKLEEGISEAELQAMIPEIEKHLPILQNRYSNEEDKAITWIQRGTRNRIFSLAAVPGFIFKIKLSEEGEAASNRAFANIVKAQEVCLAERLDLLVIPPTRKLKVGELTVIVQKCLDVRQNEKLQEVLYQFSGLDETIKQIAVFIVKAGLFDANLANMPLLDTTPRFQGNRRAALMATEQMMEGLSGISSLQGGLIESLPLDRQVELVLGAIQPHVSPEFVKKTRFLASVLRPSVKERKIRDFYGEKGILKHPGKLIEVEDLSTLDLGDLEEKGELKTMIAPRTEKCDPQWKRETITLGDAAKDVIAQVNAALKSSFEKNPIQNGAELADIQKKRLIGLQPNRLMGDASERLQCYHELGLPENKYALKPEEEHQLWLQRIIDALVAKRHLFRLELYDNRGYHIQA